jgi:hypothetical protein
MGAIASVSVRALLVSDYPNGSIHVAELHWYEAAGIGRKEFKIKQLL